MADKDGVNYCVVTGVKKITELDLEVYCHDLSQIATHSKGLLELLSVTIVPEDAKHSCEVEDLKLETCGEARNVHQRLVWQLSTPASDETGRASGLPWSSTTGPCAYFTVQIDGREIGRAYALEFVVSQQDSADWRQTGVARVRITAVGFDGRKLAELQNMIPWSFDDDDNGWVVVEHAPEYLE
jgi:hypothetical protein